jgi:hypothetical protein
VSVVSIYPVIVRPSVLCAAIYTLDVSDLLVRLPNAIQSRNEYICKLLG